MGSRGGASARGANDYTLTYDEVGNLTDDAQHHEYVYDAFGRLRKVKNQSSVVVAEYRYNGLGQRITWHYDVDADGTLESTSHDPRYHFVYDDRWRPQQPPPVRSRERSRACPAPILARLPYPPTTLPAFPSVDSTRCFHSPYPARPMRPNVACLPSSTAGWS